jgi:hypothetical protein
MKKYILLLMLAFSTAASAGEIDILKIYEQFTLASAAAGKCIKPSQDELTSFLANYQMVSVSALTELKKRKPDLTNEQANKVLKAGGVKLTNAVYGVIDKEGCESEKIQDLLKRFHMQAGWKP